MATATDIVMAMEMVTVIVMVMAMVTVTAMVTEMATATAMETEMATAMVTDIVTEHHRRPYMDLQVTEMVCIQMISIAIK